MTSLAYFLTLAMTQLVTYFTTTYCAFLQRAKQKTGRVCEAKTTCHICDAPRIAPCGSPTIPNL
jgi:hypothetical protein